MFCGIFFHSILHPTLHRTVTRKTLPLTCTAVVAFAFRAHLCFCLGGRLVLGQLLLQKWAKLFLKRLKKKVGISTMFFFHCDGNIKGRKGGKMALRSLLDYYGYDGTQLFSKFWMIFKNLYFRKMPGRKGISFHFIVYFDKIMMNLMAPIIN